ncbi:MAG: hypothetical protein AAGL10_11350 [Pseudomonadota bacterium]
MRADTKTAAEREALFEKLVELTMEREAWSDVKNQAYGVSYPEHFEQFRPLFINAHTDLELFKAITVLSNARNDRHLDVEVVEGGLQPELQGVTGQIPLAFEAGFDADGAVHFFVAGIDEDHFRASQADRPHISDRLVSVNGMELAEYGALIRPYFAHSTENHFWVRSARSFGVRNALLPQELQTPSYTLVLERENGERYQLDLPFIDTSRASMSHLLLEPRSPESYPGFEKVLDFESFDLHRPSASGVHSGRTVLIVNWYGFRSDIVEASDALIEYAVAEGLLDHDIVWDGLRSRGGGRGAYAIQRLQGKPFRTTFGNVRISDVIPPFIERRVQAFEAREAASDGTRETVGGDRWQLDWLLDDVTKAIEAGQAYSNNVPFKLAHAPKWSDGIIYPAEQHFTGEMICWMSPYGGSHYDQFAAIVADNDLCHMIGMPSGGYSNTWEWEETVTWPGTDEPVVSFMWSIGHTVRPNGEVLEGNPPAVDEFFPLTADNYQTYRRDLLRISIERLEQ